jgi:hypothetical protein
MIMSGTLDYTNDDFEFEIDVSKDFEVNVDVDFDTEASYSTEVSLESDVCVDVNIEGNLVSFNLDAQAIGDDSVVDATVTAIATDDYASLTISGVVAVGDGHKGDDCGEEPPPPPPPEDSFPVWPQDISNVVLYFETDGPNDPDDANGDGYVLIKIDNWPGGANDDLDNSIDDIMEFLIANGDIEASSVFLGAAIKGGNQNTAFYAPDGDITDVDMPPPDAPQIETPPPQGQVSGPEIDITYNYNIIPIV